MSYLKKVWLTHQELVDLYSITLSSNKVNEEFNRIKSMSNTFPAEPTPEHPLQHVIVLSYFTQDDINKLAQELDKYRDDF